MKRFKKIIEDLISLFDEYLPLEHEKLQAVQQDNVAGVEECMKREQAMILKLRGLEQKRENIQKELGWEGKPFKEILELVPPEDKQEFQDLFDRMKASVTVFQDTNQNAMDTMTLHLREIDKVIKFKDQEGRYNQEGNTLQKDRPMTNRKV